MVVADSGVWIDLFNANANPARDALRQLLNGGEVRIVAPDLCLQAVQHYRDLRRQGVTVRSSLDVLVAAFCVDRDYTAFERLRGLRGWRH